MKTKQQQIRRRNIWTIVILALLFLTPVIGSWWLYYYGEDWLPGRTNRGELIESPPQLNQLNLYTYDDSTFPADELLGQWLFVYFSRLPCETLCEDNLYKMRQARRATGKEQHRINELLLTPTEDKKPEQLERVAELLTQDYPHTTHLLVELEDWEFFLSEFPEKETAVNSGYLFIADPLGNVILAYHPERHPDDLLKDIKKLLKASQIG